MRCAYILNSNGVPLVQKIGDRVFVRSYDAEYDAEPFTNNIIEIEEG